MGLVLGKLVLIDVVIWRESAHALLLLVNNGSWLQEQIDFRQRSENM